jgi:hypothetical protein
LHPVVVVESPLVTEVSPFDVVVVSGLLTDVSCPHSTEASQAKVDTAAVIVRRSNAILPKLLSFFIR